MESINFPDNFPDSETLLNNLQDVQTCSWVIKNFNNSNIEQWLSNFNGSVFLPDDERRIALWLLSNFTYYNEKEVDHLCSDLYKKFIHEYAVKHRSTPEELLADMKKFCYIPLGNASESGGFVAYQFRKQAKIGIDRFFYSSEESVIDGNIAIFIDDVTLSATQASSYILDFKSKHTIQEIFLLTIISSDVASNELKTKGINVISCIELDDRNKCFSTNSIIFYKYPSLLNPVKKFVKHYGKHLYKYALGYKDGQYLFGFYYNVPNNTLPIFWSNQNWYPIFERKEKYKYDARVWRTFERFI